VAALSSIFVGRVVPAMALKSSGDRGCTDAVLGDNVGGGDDD
jgi:hypothetical protein